MTSGGRTSDERPGLELNQDMTFQTRTWKVERVGWSLMALAAVAGLCGLFSAGPFSQTQARDPEGLVTVEYQRFARYLGSNTIRLRLAPPATEGDTVTLRLGQALIEDMDIELIRPQPTRMSTAADGMRLEFSVADPGRPATISFSAKPQSIGAVQGEIGLPDRQPAHLDQFVYP